MKNRIFIVGLFTFYLANIAQCQYLDVSADKTNNTFLTGSLQNDLVMQASHIDGFDNSDKVNAIVYHKKYSPLAAGLFSAVIPGAGQFYTKSYWQSAAFFGAEVLTWVVYAAFEKKGDQQTDAFNQYANDHWSVIRYANWINSPNGFQQYYRSGIIIGNPPDNVSNPWNYVNWDQLNQCEEDIGSHVGSGFTHKLAPYGDQQYYEMIGKYSQFGGGWDDAATFKQDQFGNPIPFTTEDILANNGIGNVSPRTLEYEQMRKQANSSYNIATTVSFVIVANHVFSALEAAFNASKINHKIQLQGHIQSRRIYGNLVEFVPTLQVTYGL